LKKQKKALKNAKSVTSRIFLKSEQADQHCQFGNLELALECESRVKTPVLAKKLQGSDAVHSNSVAPLEQSK
jgi:hypothetical protein